MTETAAMAEVLKFGGPAAAAGAVETSWGGTPTVAAGGARVVEDSGLAAVVGAVAGDERMARAPAPLRVRQTARKSVGRRVVAAGGSGGQVEGEDGTAAATAQSKMFDPGGVQS